MSVEYPVEKTGGKDATDNERQAEDRNYNGINGWED